MELIDTFVDPSMKETNPKEYEIQVAAVEDTLAYKQAKVCEAGYQLGKAFGEWANKSLEIIKNAMQPLLNAMNRYNSNQKMIKDAKAAGHGRIVHLAKHGKYRTRKKNMNRIRKIQRREYEKNQA